jgi:hypothetical protein
VKIGKVVNFALQTTQLAKIRANCEDLAKSNLAIGFAKIEFFAHSPNTEPF